MDYLLQCGNCKHWDFMDGSILGYCRKLTPGDQVTCFYNGSNRDINYSVDGFVTRDDFGCIEWEKKGL